MAFWRKQRNAPAPLRVLMVCMGNICRSPTAEEVLRRKLQAAGIGHLVDVDSAGTGDYHVGQRPDARSIKHAGLRGYDLSKLRARQVQPEDFDRFDLILAMDDANLEALRPLTPAASRAAVALLLDHARDPARACSADGCVPDPYYSAAAGFEHVLDLVEHACDGLVEHLRERLEQSGIGA